MATEQNPLHPEQLLEEAMRRREGQKGHTRIANRATKRATTSQPVSPIKLPTITLMKVEEPGMLKSAISTEVLFLPPERLQIIEDDLMMYNRSHCSQDQRRKSDSVIRPKTTNPKPLYDRKRPTVFTNQGNVVYQQTKHVIDRKNPWLDHSNNNNATKSNFSWTQTTAKTSSCSQLQ